MGLKDKAATLRILYVSMFATCSSLWTLLPQGIGYLISNLSLRVASVPKKKLLDIVFFLNYYLSYYKLIINNN